MGTENQRSELHRQLEFAAGGEGSIKFLRGGYGCGKTFMARLAFHDAQSFKERAFIERLVNDVTSGFKADVGVVPRQFLREFVTQLDYVDENPDYEPMKEYAFKAKELTVEEEHILTGQTLVADDATGELVPSEDVW